MTEAETKARERIPAHNALKDQLTAVRAERADLDAAVVAAKVKLDAAKAAHDAAAWAYGQWEQRAATAERQVQHSEAVLRDGGLQGPF